MIVSPKTVHYAFRKHHKGMLSLSELYVNIWGENVPEMRKSIKKFCEKVNQKFKDETNDRRIEEWIAFNIHCWIKDPGAVVFEE